MNSLPKLIFGNNRSSQHSDLKSYSDQVAKVVSSLQQFEALTNPAHFQSSTSLLKINQLHIIASASTPVFVSASSFDNISLMIPFYGENHTQLDGKTYHWIHHQYAVLMPNTSRSGTSSTRSMLTIDLNTNILFEMAEVMLGKSKVQLSELRLHEPRLIPLVYGGFSFDMAIRKLCLYTDTLWSSSVSLTHLGIDDQFYRLIVMMLIPEKFFTDDPLHISPADSKSAMRILCDYTESTHHRFECVADIERFTGLSTRSLQMAFKKHPLNG